MTQLNCLDLTLFYVAHLYLHFLIFLILMYCSTVVICRSNHVLRLWITGLSTRFSLGMNTAMSMFSGVTNSSKETEVSAIITCYPLLQLSSRTLFLLNLKTLYLALNLQTSLPPIRLYYTYRESSTPFTFVHWSS